MKEQGIYFATSDFKNVVSSCGGQWNDRKERPIVCLVRSQEDSRIYWAIPMGDMAHRSQEQRDRINTFLSYPDRDIRSCYYHVARTDKESLFFISDAIPITDEYIEREYTVGGQGYVIKNQATINELRRKLARILAYENRMPNRFRQHITDVKKYLMSK